MPSSRRGVAIAVSAAILCAHTAPLSATGSRLPQDKRHIDGCIGAALAAHPGIVEKVAILDDGDSMRVRVYLHQTGSQAEWIAVCDGKTGKILKSVVVDDS
jgi:hypothetical protein